MKLRVVIALGLAVSALAAVEAQKVDQQTQLVAVVGRVVDVATGQGIAGATVRVVVEGGDLKPGAVLTAEKGGFLFRLPAGTKLTVRAQKPGFFGGQYLQWGPRFPGESLIVPKQSASLEITIPMWRAGVVTGRVLDAAGDPAIAVKVIAFTRDTSAGVPRFVRASSTSTDDRGVYRIAGLEPASYAVAALLGRPENPGFLVYAPSTFLPSAASVASVAPGTESAGIDLVLPPEVSLSVSGRLVGSVEWNEHDRVTLDPVDAGGPGGDVATASVPVDQAGKFAFSGVSPGRYRIRFVRLPRPDGGVIQTGLRIAIKSPAQPVPRMTLEPTWWGESVVELGDRDLDVVIPVKRGARISGLVRFAAGTRRPAPEALATAMILLVREDGDSIGSMPMAGIEADGRFSSVELPAGRYCVVVPPFSLPGLVAESIEVAGREAATVELGSDDVTTVSINLTAPTDLRGTVLDGRNRPTSDVAVYVFPTDNRFWVGYTGMRVRFARSKQDGKYVLEGLPPGEYFVAATPGAPADDWSLLETLRGLTATAKRISIHAGVPTIQDFTVRPVR